MCPGSSSVHGELPAPLKVALKRVVEKDIVTLLNIGLETSASASSSIRNKTYRLVGDILAKLLNGLLAHVGLENVTQVLDRSLEVTLVVLEQLRHVVALEAARVSSDP